MKKSNDYSITTIKEDILVNPELEGELQQAENDISHNNVYSTDEVLEMIEQGEV